MMEKKKVGIITILKVNNFGAELQAYATQEVMNLMGYDAEIIDYLYYRNPLHKKEPCSYPFFPYPLKNRIKEWGLHIMDKVRAMGLSKEVKERNARFAGFHKSFNRFSPVQYRCYSDLYANPPVYDAYCVGSDQVWNPRCYTNLNPYFLTFAPREAKRFSYASSFGVGSLPDNAKEPYKKCLLNLSSISVRESEGTDIVRSLTGKEATLVADPTLLLDENEWMKVEKSVSGIPERYVLVYELHPLQNIMELAHKIAQRMGIKVVRLCKDESSKKNQDNVINVVNVGPSEFVYLFRHASMVVTNSFHGTAFSINFKKNFYCVLSKQLSNNGRQLSLLSLCGLTDRVAYNQAGLPDIDRMEVDYSKVDCKLNAFVEKSKKYIRRAIDGEE